MATTTETLLIAIEAQNKAGAALRQVKDDISAVAAQSKEAQAATTSLGSNLGSTIAGFVSLAAAAAAVKAVLSTTYESIKQYEQLSLSLQSLSARELVNTGRAQDMTQALKMAIPVTKELLDWTQKLAIESPFRLEEVAQAFRMGMAYGFTTDQSKRLTAAMIDFASATGASGDAMRRIAMSLGQMQAQGKLTGMEMRELTLAGLPVTQILAKAFNVTTAEIINMREKGLIPAGQAIEAIVQSLEGDFAGAAKRTANSWAGIASTLDDLVKVNLREFFQGTFDVIQPMLASITTLLQDPTFKELVKQRGGELGGTINDAAKTLQVSVAGWKAIGDLVSLKPVSRDEGFYNAAIITAERDAAAWREKAQWSRTHQDAEMVTLAEDNIARLQALIAKLQEARGILNFVPAEVIRAQEVAKMTRVADEAGRFADNLKVGADNAQGAVSIMSNMVWLAEFKAAADATRPYGSPLALDPLLAWQNAPLQSGAPGAWQNEAPTEADQAEVLRRNIEAAKVTEAAWKTAAQKTQAAFEKAADGMMAKLDAGVQKSIQLKDFRPGGAGGLMADPNGPFADIFRLQAWTQDNSWGDIAKKYGITSKEQAGSLIGKFQQGPGAWDESVMQMFDMGKMKEALLSDKDATGLRQAAFKKISEATGVGTDLVQATFWGQDAENTGAQTARVETVGVDMAGKLIAGVAKAGPDLEKAGYDNAMAYMAGWNAGMSGKPPAGGAKPPSGSGFNQGERAQGGI
jgi:tape measure domain-containing protein